MDEKKAKAKAEYHGKEVTAESRGSEQFQTDMEFKRMVEAWSKQCQDSFEAGYLSGYNDGTAEAGTRRSEE